MEQGQRYNAGKLKWSLVPFRALEPMVEVLMFGTKKYSRDNWKKGLPYTEICDSLLRHTKSFLGGRNRDKESKLLEVGHILCNALFLSWMVLFRPDLDDRNVEYPDAEIDEDETFKNNNNP